MNEKQIFALLHRLWLDLQHPGFYWVAFLLLLTLGFSWWLSFLLRSGDARAGLAPRSALRKFGTGSLKRMAFPLIAMVLVFLLRSLLTFLEWPHLNLLRLAGPLLASWALVRMLVYLLRSVFPHGGVLSSFERLISLAVWGSLILHVTGLADPVIEMLEQVRFSAGKQSLDLWMLINGVLTIGLTLLAALWVGSLLERHLMGAAAIEANLRVVLSRLTKALLLVIALLLGLSLVGIDITALSVFSGALAVGLGIGLQKVASNYVSGFIILLDHSIRLGNLVSVDEQTTGTITRITTRYTVLRTLTGTEVIIPNEYLVSNLVRNLSYTDTKVRVTVKIQVSYSTDIERAMSLMIEAARCQARVLADPPPGVLLTEFADSGINLELGVWIGDPEEGTGAVRSDISLEILRSFRAHGVEIPFPQREIRVIPPGILAPVQDTGG